jgi:general secretion pathway protein A
MYESFYGLTEKPFNLTPDPKYLYLSQRHTEAFAHLEFGRRERGGFIVITGEVGTGKTTLARYFLSRLDSRTATAFVLYPALTGAELLRTTLEDLKVPVTGTSLKDHVDALHRFLLESRAASRDVVLLIDEAQDLSAEVLEQVRLISNLETDTEKLIQIVLMGQSELQTMLGRHELRQLAQRVTARYHLGLLDRQETEEYVRHRLEVAGGAGKVVFTAGALSAARSLSGGIPRLINLICDRALLAGYVQGSRVVDARMVRRAASEVRGEGAPSPFRRPAMAIASVAVAAAALGGAAMVPRPGPAAPALVAVAASTLAPATTVPAAPERSFEQTVLDLARGPSQDAAVHRVEEAWGPGPLQRTIVRANLDQLRRLDVPAVLELFHPGRRDTAYVALLGLAGDDARIHAGGREMRVPVAELDRLWTRQAQVLWRDYDGAAEPDRAEAWTREALAHAGYTATPLSAAVLQFQRDAQLTPDGVIGARTLLALYVRGPWPRPRLGAPSGARP